MTTGPFLLRLMSNDGTKYNIRSWFQFFGGTIFFVFFVSCGSYITPWQNLPYIITCFIVSGIALVAAVYAVVKLVTFQRIKASRSRRRDLDDEGRLDTNQDQTTYPDSTSRSDPIPIRTVLKSIFQNSPSPPYSPERNSTTASLLGLNSDDSLKSRSWNYFAAGDRCRFRRAFSYDSSVSSVPDVFVLRDGPGDSTTDIPEVYSSSLVEYPVYVMPEKTGNRRSGDEESGFDNALDFAGGSGKTSDASRRPDRPTYKNSNRVEYPDYGKLDSTRNHPLGRSGIEESGYDNAFDCISNSSCETVIVSPRNELEVIPTVHSSSAVEYPVFDMPHTAKNPLLRRSGYDKAFDCKQMQSGKSVVESPARASRCEHNSFKGAVGGSSVAKDKHLYNSQKYGRVDKTIKRRCRKTHGKWYLRGLPDAKDRSRVYIGKCRRVTRKELLKMVSGAALSNNPDMLLDRKNYSYGLNTEV